MHARFILLLGTLICCGFTMETGEASQIQMSSSQSHVYKVQESLKPAGLDKISDEQINQHWDLYKGYVRQVNDLSQELVDLRAKGEGATLQYADRRRRFNFEFNGMVLHEYYFGNLKKDVAEPTNGKLYDALVRDFGSFEAWKNDFSQAGKTRGIGWAILYADAETGHLSNHFIAEHENGNIAGFQPILVLDVWEHAYMVDHGAGGRGAYIAAFMDNIDWDKVTTRFSDVMQGKISKRF